MILDTRSFDTQKEASKFCSVMLNRYRPEQCVFDDDVADLAALLKRYPEYEEKVGVGVNHFEVMSAEYEIQCFRIVRKDGTVDDFSYQHCIARTRAG